MESGTCAPSQTVVASEYPPHSPTSCDNSVASITDNAHFPSMPIDPSTMMAYYAHPFDQNRASQIPSTPGNTSVSSFPTSPPASSSRSDSSRFGSEGVSDYLPPSDHDEDYRPARATTSRSQRKRKLQQKAKPTPRTAFPSSPTPSSESGKSVADSRSHRRARPYRRSTAPRNFQVRDGASLTGELSELRCPVPGCGKRSQRVPDLRRHIKSHKHWLEPNKWTCCGIATEEAHLYGIEIAQGATREELIEGGAYVFEGRLMVGGCMTTFSRRDALKRHVDNPNFPCVGDMDSYPH